jgi:hypothetical protein
MAMVDDSHKGVFGIRKEGTNEVELVGLSGEYARSLQKVLQEQLQGQIQECCRQLQLKLESPVTDWSEEENAQLDEIFTQLHEADDYIAKTRQNTTRLRVETRSMLNDLRKQLS